MSNVEDGPLAPDDSAVPVQASLARRIAAGLIAISAVSFLLHWAYLPIVWLTYETPSSSGSGFVVSALYADFALAPLFIFALLLVRWQRMMFNGVKPWFLKVRPAAFVWLSILLVGLWTLPALSGLHYMPSRVPTQPPQWLMPVLFFGASTLSCLLWIWWCDDGSRTAARAIAAAVVAWLMSSMLNRAGVTLWLVIQWTMSGGNRGFLGGALLLPRQLSANVMSAVAAIFLYVVFRRVQQGSPMSVPDNVDV